MEMEIGWCSRVLEPLFSILFDQNTNGTFTKEGRKQLKKLEETKMNLPVSEESKWWTKSKA